MISPAQLAHTDTFAPCRPPARAAEWFEPGLRWPPLTDVEFERLSTGHVLSVPITTVGVGSDVDVNVNPLRVIAEEEVPAVL